MTLGRREFFIRAAAVGAGVTLGHDLVLGGEPVALPPGKAASGKAELRISSQDGIIPGGSLREKVEKMEKWGFDGLEVWGGGLPGRVKEIQEALRGTRIRLGAICAGYDGVMVSDDREVRGKAISSMREILAAAGELGSTGLVCVPAFNGQTKLGNKECREVLLEILPELADAAQKAGTRLLLEPLNRGEAFFLRLLADGAAICRDARHPAVCMMGDFYHMGIEETSDLGAFISAGSYLHHVHLATTEGRTLPGDDGGKRSYVDGFRGLKIIGYQDYCSFECGVRGDHMTAIPKAMQFLKSQWAQA